MTTGRSTAAALGAFLALGALAASGEEPPAKLPEGALRRLGSANLRHHDRLAALAFSKDDRAILSASVDAVFMRSSTGTGERLARPVGSYGHHRCIAISPDGSLYAAGEYGDAARIRIIAVPQEGRPRELEGHKGDVKDLAFAPGGASLASASMDGTVRIWDTAKWEATRTIQAHEGGATSVAWSPDGKTLATGGADGVVRLRDALTGDEKGALPRKHKEELAALVFSTDGATLYAADVNWTVRAWRLEKAELLWEKLVSDRGEKRDVFDQNWRAWCNLAPTPDGAFVAFPDGRGTICVLHAATGKVRTTITLERDGASRLAFSNDGALLAIGTENECAVRIYEWKTDKERNLHEGHSSAVSTIAFSPDGKLLASGSDDATVRLWDAATGGSVAVLEGHEQNVTRVAFSPDGTELASGSHDYTVRFWDVAKRAKRRVIRIGGSGQREVSSLAFSPSGEEIAVSCWNDTIHVFDAKEGDELRVFGVAAVVIGFSADGKSLLTAAKGDVLVLDAAAGTERRRIEARSAWRTVLSKDRTLLVAPGEGSVRVFDVATGAEKRTLALEGGGSMVDSAFSADGRLVATAGFGGHVEIFDVASGERLARYGDRRPGAWNLASAFSPDGSILATAARDSSITFWKVPAK